MFKTSFFFVLKVTLNVPDIKEGITIFQSIFEITGVAEALIEKLGMFQMLFFLVEEENEKKFKPFTFLVLTNHRKSSYTRNKTPSTCLVQCFHYIELT